MVDFKKLYEGLQPVLDAAMPFLPVAVRGAIEVARMAIRAGENAAPFIKIAIQGGAKTPEESASLVAARKRLSGTLQEELPPEES